MNYFTFGWEGTGWSRDVKKLFLCKKHLKKQNGCFVFLMFFIIFIFIWDLVRTYELLYSFYIGPSQNLWAIALKEDSQKLWAIAYI
jgi:hypothetical protein